MAIGALSLYLLIAVFSSESADKRFVDECAFLGYASSLAEARARHLHFGGIRRVLSARFHQDLVIIRCGSGLPTLAGSSPRASDRERPYPD
jgi:hypothetical protein